MTNLKDTILSSTFADPKSLTDKSSLEFRAILQCEEKISEAEEQVSHAKYIRHLAINMIQEGLSWAQILEMLDEV